MSDTIKDTKTPKKWSPSKHDLSTFEYTICYIAEIFNDVQGLEIRVPQK